jgi:citrate lyase subunit beta-like protein
MGFTGKQVIHPMQVDSVQKKFTPTATQVNWAFGLIAAFEEHQKTGKGAFTFGGQMIDKPSLLQAKNIVNILNKSIHNKSNEF